MKEKQYNILLLMTDQQRFDTLAYTGNKIIKTPNLDRLAAEGTIFKNAYTACPSCVPARATLMTGMNQWNTGILGMGRGQHGMGIGFTHTLPGELAEAGYHTQGVGKMHFHPQRSLNGFHNIALDESGRTQDPGFVSDYRKWFDENKDGDYDIIAENGDWNGWGNYRYHAPEELHPTNWTVNESINFLQKRDWTKPFFLKTSFARPHSPYDCPERFYNLYKDQAIPLPDVGDWAHIHNDPETARKIYAWRGIQSAEDIHNARASYYGNITFIDEAIGRLLAFLEEIDQVDNTIILFTTDHGDMLGDHNLWRKTYAYEGSAHIPMIVRLPKGMQQNVQSSVSAPVMLRDVMPTLLDAAQVAIPESVDGKSMLPLIYGNACQWRDYVHGEHCTCYSEEQEMQYLTDGRIKYIWFPRLGTEQLFNLEDDPGELTDLSQQAEHEGLLHKWRHRLVSELAPRNCGLTNGDQLICQKDHPPIVSPNYQRRLANSEFKWM